MRAPVRVPFSGAVLFAICSLACASPAQRQVWIVDRALGAGAHFADLPQAVAAASSGDVLLVRSGTYTGFSTAKGLSVIAELGTHPAVIEAAPGVTTHGLQIAGLPASERFDLIGCNVRAPINFGVACDVANCAGEVEIEWCGLSMDGGSGAANARPGLLVRSSPRVIVSKSALSGVPALRVDGSEVELVGCSILGNRGGLFSPNPGSIAGHGAFARNSVVEASHCNFRGGDGESFPGGYEPGSGIASENSTWILRDDWHGYAIAGAASGTAVPAASGTGLVRAGPRFRFIPTGGGPEVTAGLQLVREALPSLVVTYFPATTRMWVTATGDPGDLYLFLFGLPIDPLPIPGLGELRLDPALGPFVMAAGSISTQGNAEIELTTSTDPLLFGVRFGWQGVQTAGAGFAFTNLATYVHR